MTTFIQDIRLALRLFAKQPAFVLAIFLTLGLGIGANTAIFSVVNAVVLRPLPYQQPERIVRIRCDRPFTLEEMEAFQRQSQQFEVISGYANASFTLTGEGNPEIVEGAAVSSNHFKVLGVSPVQGRFFSADDQSPGAEPVVVISYGLWQSRFGGKTDILGKRIALHGPDAERRTVIGVLPLGFHPLDPGWRAWVAQIVDPTANDYVSTARLGLVGRLDEGASIESAGQELAAVVRHLIEESPTRRLDNFRLVSLYEAVVGDVDRTLFIMLAAVGIVLLIACANVANLLLGRTQARVHEMAIRTALGAGRPRLMRQLLTESLLLGLLGGLVGLAVAYLGVTALGGTLPSNIPRTAEIDIDSRVLYFALGLSILAGILFGMAPAARLWLTDLQRFLREGRQQALGSKVRLNYLLVVAEIAMAVILAAGAGLMVKSLWLLNRVNPGFDPDGVLTMQLLPPDARYSEARALRGFYGQALERIRALPGVQSAEAAFPLPMTTGAISIAYEVEGRPLEEGARPPYAGYNTATSGFLAALGIPILEGRDFSDQDREGQPAVALINETMAHRLFPGGSAVGKQIRWRGNPWFRVVGVVGDVRQHRLDSDVTDMVYRPFQQEAWLSNLYLTVRTRTAPVKEISGVRQAIWSVDTEVPVVSIQSMRELIGATQSDSRFFALLLVLSGGLALVLGAVGVYGVMSLTVRGRRHEYGVRMAMGASSGAIVRQSLRRALATVVVGLALGLAGTIATSHVLSSLLYGVSETDPSMLAAVALALSAVAMAAAYIPARRAGAVDPLSVLRSE